MWPISLPYPELTARQVGVPIEEKESLGNENGDGIYDYIVVGGGTAGCVVASRLSEDPNVKVLLVERGPVADTWASRNPLISSDFIKDGAPVLKWETVPQKNANGQQIQIVAGKELGGTSRINSMLYTRGAPAEWNSWSEAGRKGWSYDDMLPYFMKSEKASDSVTGKYHGKKGEWCVRFLRNWSFRFWPWFIKASSDFGFPLIEDVNDPAAPIVGCAKIPRTQDPSGKRHAVSSAFLPLKLAHERKSHLKICTSTIATKIEFEGGEKLRAEGLCLQSESDGSKTFYVKAKREIIISSGTFGSPHLLLLSGIGPTTHLQEHGIRPIKDLRGVGEHLMDHVGVPLTWKVPLKDSLNVIQSSIWVAIVQFFEYLIYGTGLFTMPFAQVVLLVRSAILSASSRLAASPPEPGSSISADLDAHKSSNIVDLEIIPIPINPNPATVFATKGGVFALLCILVQPKSTGSVRLASPNPRERPITDLGFLSEPGDVAVLRKGLKLALSIARKMKEQSWAAMQDLELPVSEEDDVLDEYIKRGILTALHYTSTCRMAPEGEGGVVDDELRVHGVDGLRVADASIFPSILATHTQAPAVAVAEKCADMIKGTYA